ncbi:MAG: hypothetical protein ACOCXG_02425 [Nanoarchaeota archaeon]
MRKFLLLTIGILFFVMIANARFYCECEVPTYNASVEVKSADLVFAGKVIEKEIEEVEGDAYFYTFEPFMVWTTPENMTEFKEVKILTKVFERDCGFPFEVDQNYLVYARYNYDGDFETSMCERTVLYRNATLDLEQIGEGKIITREKPNEIIRTFQMIGGWITGLLDFITFIPNYYKS